MIKPNVALSSLVTQAWDQLQGQVLKEIGQRIEELAEAERETRLGRARHARGGASPWRRWGYRVRKVLLTPWGLIQGLRLPRIRDVEKKQEVGFLSSDLSQARLAEMLLASTLGGVVVSQGGELGAASPGVGDLHRLGGAGGGSGGGTLGRSASAALLRPAV